MPRPLVSIVLATYQRAHLLARSLYAYAASEGLTPCDDLELIVVDDGSWDGTDELVKEWSRGTGIRAVVLTPHPKLVQWQDCGAVLNYGIRASSGHHVLLTHPEVIPGRKSISACVDQLILANKKRGNYDSIVSTADQLKHGVSLGLYACCPIYYLSSRDQELIDTVPWREKGNLAVRDIPGFYDEDANGNIDYQHAATDIVAQPCSRLPQWESWVFGGCSRETWKRMGGMLETNKWGAVDIAFLARRRVLGVPTHTTPDPETICVHQNHDLPGDVKTPRDMAAWERELSAYNLKDPRLLCHPEVDNLGW